MFGGCKPPHNVFTSIVVVYEVFEYLDMLWMGIWVHPYTLHCASGGQILENGGAKGEPK
jgi:hypothetical protein